MAPAEFPAEQPRGHGLHSGNRIGRAIQIVSIACGDAKPSPSRTRNEAIFQYSSGATIGGRSCRLPKQTKQRLFPVYALRTQYIGTDDPGGFLNTLAGLSACFLSSSLPAK